MRVLICGSRTYSNAQRLTNTMEALMDHIGSIHVVIEGGAEGADTMARLWAENAGIPVQTFKPDWMKHGKAAGPIRNREMLEVGKPDIVVAFVDGEELAASKGTANMVGQAERAGIEVHVVYDDGVHLH